MGSYLNVTYYIENKETHKQKGYRNIHLFCVISVNRIGIPRTAHPRKNETNIK